MKFEELVNLAQRFEVAAPRTFSLVCFRLLPKENNLESANRLNRALLDAVNSTGKLFISHTYALRFAVGAPLTEERHVFAAWTTLQEKASDLQRNFIEMKGSSIYNFFQTLDQENYHLNEAVVEISSMNQGCSLWTGQNCAFHLFQNDF